MSEALEYLLEARRHCRQCGDNDVAQAIDLRLAVVEAALRADASARPPSDPSRVCEKWRTGGEWKNCEEFNDVVRRADERLKEAFLAGEQAAHRRFDHGWGPEPRQGDAAFREWLNTCAAGHIIRVKGCAACLKVAPPRAGAGTDGAPR